MSKDLSQEYDLKSMLRRHVRVPFVNLPFHGFLRQRRGRGRESQ